MAHDSITDENRIDTMQELIGYVSADVEASGEGRIHVRHDPDPVCQTVSVAMMRNGHIQPRWTIIVSEPHDSGGHHWPAQLHYSGIVTKTGLDLLAGLHQMMWTDRER